MIPLGEGPARPAQEHPPATRPAAHRLHDRCRPRKRLFDVVTVSTAARSLRRSRAGRRRRAVPALRRPRRGSHAGSAVTADALRRADCEYTNVAQLMRTARRAAAADRPRELRPVRPERSVVPTLGDPFSGGRPPGGAAAQRVSRARALFESSITQRSQDLRSCSARRARSGGRTPQSSASTEPFISPDAPAGRSPGSTAFDIDTADDWTRHRR